MTKSNATNAGSATGATTLLDAVIIGAGFSGLYQLHKLRGQGMKVRAIEAAPEVGGTWYWNCYPGARTDSPSHVYQFWFSDELLDEWDWQERYPGQQEAERYLNHVADRFDLRKDITLSTRVESARWDEAAQRWLVQTDTGEKISAQFLVTCVGTVSAPVTPPFAGNKAFKGKTLHTARWPREGVDLKGKRVGVIGTGATGIQVIQSVAPEAAHLTVFQRTPNYAIPIRNPQYSKSDFEQIRQNYPTTREVVRNTFVGFDADIDPRDWHDVPADERLARLEELWADGSLKFWMAGFKEVFMDADINKEISDFVKSKIRPRIKDPALAEKLLPSDHGFGTKRVPLENGYFETYNRDNVTLVDLRTEAIEAITEKGIRTSVGEYDLDVLIFATGFDAATGALTRIDIRGRDNISLKEEWERDLRSTMGLQVHGFPNMFMTMAPLAPAAAFCNAPTCLQQQVEWISDCIEHVRAKQATKIEPSAETEANWIAHHEEVASMTLVAKTKSWYTGANIEGKTNRLLGYIGGVGVYRQLCDEVKEKGYEGFEIA